MSVMPPSPLSYTGEVAVPYITKTFPPLSTNNRFSVPTLWVDTAAQEFYLLAANKYILGVLTAEWVKIGDVSGTVEGIVVDAHTAPGTSPVLPDSSSNPQVITITGGQVASGTTSNVIQTNSLAANTFTVQIQRASAQASPTVGRNGVSHFDSASFAVDSNGFVQLLGTGEAVDSFTPDTGTSPVVPTIAGVVSVRGQISANTSGIQVTGGTNILNIAMFSPFVGDFSFLSNTSGETRKLLVSNTVDGASSGAQVIVSVAGSLSGDASIIWSTTVTDWSAGIDNSASDAWVLAKSTSLGTTNAISISTSLVSTFSNNIIATINSAGSAVSVSAQNQDNSNTGSHAFLEALVAGTSGGDAYLGLRVSGGRAYAFGIDTPTSGQPLKLTTGTGGGTNPGAGTTIWQMVPAGSRTLPLQPAFMAYVTADQSNVTGDNTVYTIITYTENFDQQSNFNPTTGVFTAPVAGKYLLNLSITLSGVGATHTNAFIEIQTTGQNYGLLVNPAAVEASGLCTFTKSVLVSMSAGDTAVMSVTVSGGTKTVGIRGTSAATDTTRFSGNLVA